jgi:hypothetical protein
MHSNVKRVLSPFCLFHRGNQYPDLLVIRSAPSIASFLFPHSLSLKLEEVTGYKMAGISVTGRPGGSFDK